MQGLEHGDLISLLGQVAGAGQAGRAGADDGNLVAVGGGTGRLLGAVLIVPVGHKALQTADANGLALDAADAVLLALALLGADAAADGGQRAGLVDHLIGTLEIMLIDLLDELRDLHVDGAAAHAGMVLAVEAAGSLIQGLLLGIAESHLQEVFVADVGILGGHLVLFQTHVGHFTRPPS